MPIIECGPAPFTPVGGVLLVSTGPTVLIDVGFDPAIITQTIASPASIMPPAGSGAPYTPPVTGPITSRVQNIPALIDTGATLSCIDDSLAQQLQLPLINQTQSMGAHGLGTLNVYLAYIMIPGLGAVQAGEFIGAIMNLPNQIHRALIGRSLLSTMLLVYDGRTGSVKLAN